MEKGELLQEVKNMILWSLLLDEKEKEDLLPRVEKYNNDQLEKLLAALKNAQQKEDSVFETLGEIEPDLKQKIKKTVKEEKKNMLQEAEKQEAEETTVEKLLEDL